MLLDAEPELTSRPRILVVDDSRVIRVSINKTLSGEFQLTEAGDGEAAWEVLADDPGIQVVITDVEMPRLNGHALLSRIRASEIPRVRDIPVIVITGASDDASRQKALSHGASDFITKPLDPLQLLARTRSHAKLDRTTRKLVETTATLEQESTTDALTQLGSRRLLMLNGERDYAYARRHGVNVSVIRMDIDGFDTLRHRYGDETMNRVLTGFAALIRSRIRKEDTAARISKAGFAIVTPSAGRFEAAILAEYLRKKLAHERFVHGGQTFGVTLSSGIATLGRDPGDTFEAIVALAQRRLTAAAADGGDRLNVHDEADPGHAMTRLEAVPDFDAALQLLRDGRIDSLAPHLAALLTRLMPLLELANRELGLAIPCEELKNRLAARG